MWPLVGVALLATAGGLLLWAGARLEGKHRQPLEPQELEHPATPPLTEDALKAMGWYPLNDGSGMWATDL